MTIMQLVQAKERENKRGSRNKLKLLSKMEDLFLQAMPSVKTTKKTNQRSRSQKVTRQKLALNGSSKMRKLMPMKRINGEENVTQLVQKWPNSREEIRISAGVAAVLEIVTSLAKAVNKEKIGEVSFLKSQGKNR